MASKKGLGKGLDSLISKEYTQKSTARGEKKEDAAKLQKESAEPVTVQTDGLQGAQFIDIALVERNKEQPRRIFEQESLDELAESIRQFGILQPLLVKKEKNHYVIIAGERRWRAAKIAGCKKVPVIIKDYSNQEIMEISLIENIQREDLNAIEEAMAYQKLLDEFGYRQEDLAKKLSRSRTAITNRLRLLKLSPVIQEMVKNEELSEGHARALLALSNEEEQNQAARLVIEKQMSVRETERLVKKLAAPLKPEKATNWQKEDQFVYDQLEEDLRSVIGTKVAIKRQEKDKGKIVIDYYSTEELERIMDLLKHR